MHSGPGTGPVVVVGPVEVVVGGVIVVDSILMGGIMGMGLQF